MKSLIDYIKEEKEEKIYVVRDEDDMILGMSEIKDNAQEEADEYNKELPGTKAKVKTEKKSDYIK